MKKVIVAIIFLLLFNLNVCSAKTNNVAPYEMKKANNIIVQKLNNGGITVNTRTATIYDSYQGKNVSVEYDTFIPAGVNPNSKVIIYSADLDSYSTLKQSILNSNLDSIVVYYKLNWIGPDSYKRLATEIMSDLKQEYNLSSNYYIADGFSQKAHTAIKGMVDYLSANPTEERQLILLNDGYPLNDSADLLTNADISVLEQNDTFIVDYCQKDYINNKGYSSQYWKSLGTKLLNANLDILFVSPEALPSNEFWTNHAYIYSNPYDNGFYDKLLAFIYDGADLPESGYIYRIYDHTTGIISEYSAYEVKAKLGNTLNYFNNHGSYSSSNESMPDKENTTSCNYNNADGKPFVLEIDHTKQKVSLKDMSFISTGGIFEGINYSSFKDMCPNNVFFNVCTSNENIYYSVTTSEITNNSSCKSYKYVKDGFSETPENNNNNGEKSIQVIPNKAVEASCDTLLGDPKDSNDLAYWLQKALDIIKYGGIIALIVLSIVDFAKAIFQNNKDLLKEHGTTFLKRLVYCVVLFFIPMLVNLIMTLLGAYGICNIG